MEYKFKLKRLLSFYLIILQLSTISSSSAESNDQTKEQWKAIDISDIRAWSIVDDVNLTDKSIFFYRNPESSTSISDIGGAAWSHMAIGNKKGLKITFVPSIEVDSNFVGNAKYPQGFAIVLTTSNVKNDLKGEKGPGLGYDGINNAITFEFDFIQQKDRNDLRDPHFSLHHNLQGRISSITPSNCMICNKKLPNFYDRTNENFEENLKIVIELYDESITVYTNRIQENIILEKTPFSVFGDLMESEQVFIGITASMNLYKSVTIKNFNLFEIKEAKEGKISLQNNKNETKIDDPIVVNYQSLSSAGIPLRIYQNEFQTIELYVSGKKIENVVKVFNMNQMALVLTTNDITSSGLYSLIVKRNKEGLSNVEQFEMLPGSKEQYDLCLDIYNYQKYEINFKYNFTSIKHDSTHFYFYICAYDQYYNKKQFSKHLKLILSIGYPHHYEPDEEIIDTFEDEKTKMLIKAPFVGFGIYSIVGMDFISVKNRTFDFSKQEIDFSNSFGDVMGAVTRTTSDQSVSFRIVLKDQLNKTITKDELAKLKCNIDHSKFIPQPTNDEVNYDYDYPIISFKPIESKYTFYPILQCEDKLELIFLNCFECEVYIQQSLHSNDFKLYSDYYNRYFLFSELHEGNELVISLDEKTNRKITTLSLVDSNLMDFENSDKKITITDITLKDQYGSDIALKSEIIPSGIDIYIDGFDRNNTPLSPLLVFELSININVGDTNYLQEKINIKFRSKDDWINNLNEDPVNDNQCIAEYKQNTKTIQANENILLYEVFCLNTKKGITSKIDCNSINLSIFNTIECINTGYSCLVYSSITTAYSSKQTVDIRYNTNLILQTEFLIINNNQINRLKMLNIPVDKDLDEIQLDDIDVFTPVSFSLQMIDIYNNPITTNSKDAFNSLLLNLINTSVELRFNGIISVSSNVYIPGEQRIECILPNGNKKTVKYKRISRTIDPTTSNASIEYPTSSIINKEVLVIIDLKDSNYNQLSISIASAKIINKIKVIAVKQDYSFIDCKYSETASSSETLKFNCTIPQSGEYSIQAFFDNIPIICQGCIINAKTSKDDIQMYIIGNKKKIPVYSTNNKYQIVDKTAPLSIMIDIRNNDYESYSLIISSETSNSKARFCTLKDTTDELRHVYTICSDSIETFKQLPNGLYKIAVNTKSFNIFLTDTIFTAKEIISPSSTYSMLMTYSNSIIGSIDNPGIAIIDFRTEEMQRYLYMDLSKIEVKLIESTTRINAQFYFNSEKGLITALFNHNTIGEFEFSIFFNGNEILKGYTYINYPGSLNSLTLLSSSIIKYMEANYILLQAKDNEENICQSDISLQSELNIHNIITISQQDKYLNSFKVYNPLTGVIAIKLDKHIVDIINVNSEFFPQPKIIVIKPDVRPENFHAHYDVDDISVKIIVIGDDNNEIPFYQLNEVLDKNNFIVDVLMKNNENGEYEYYQQIQLNIDTEQKVFKFSLSNLKTYEDYKLVPFYLGFPIQCPNCHMIKNHDHPSLDLTKVFIKNGANNWIELSLVLEKAKILFNKSAPLFKLQFSGPLSQMDSFEEKLNCILKANKNEIKLDSYVDSNNNAYMFIQDKETYFQLPSRFVFTLEITYASTSTTTSQVSIGPFHVFETQHQIQSKQLCFDNNVSLSLINPQKTYQIRPSEELILEFKLNGCERTEKEFVQLSDLHALPIIDNWSFTFIHSDYSDLVLLFIKGKIKTEKSQIISVNYKKNNHNLNITIQVLSNTVPVIAEIDKTRLKYSLSDTHAYFYLKAKDLYNNKLTLASNPILNPINLATVRDSKNNIVPFRMTYDFSETEYNIICEFNIFSIDQYAIKLIGDLNNQYYITIECDAIQSFSNSYVSINKIDTEYELNIILLDSKNDELKPSTCSIDYLDTFTFYFYSIDQITGESFSFKITNAVIKNKENPNVITFTLNEDIPHYQYYSIMTYYHTKPLVCINCIYKNDMPLAYKLSLDNHFSYLTLSQPLNIESKIEHPFLIIFSFKSKINIKPTSNFDFGQTSYLYNKCSIIVIGFNTKNHFSQFLSDKIVLEIDNNPLTIFFHKNYKISTSPPSLTNISFYGKKSYSFTVNEPFEFYIELRDMENILTSAQTQLDLLSQLPEINSSLMIPTTVKGLYYIIITSQQLIKTNSFIIETKEGKSSLRVFINSQPAFPSSLNIIEEFLLTTQLTRISISSFDDYINSICDYRMGIITQDTNGKHNQYEIYSDKKGNCFIEVLFSGIMYIQSPLLSMNKIAIYNLKSGPNPFASSLSINPSTLSKNNTIISLTFSIALNSGFVYLNNMSIDNMKLAIYKVISDTKYQLVQEIDGLYTLLYLLSPMQLNMEIGNLYAFIPIINNKQFSKLQIIKYSNPSTIISSIRLYKNDRNVLTQLTLTREIEVAPIEMPYPLHFKIVFLNTSQEKIFSCKADILTAKLFLKKDNSEILPLDSICDNDSSLIITINNANVNKYLQLPKGEFLIIFQFHTDKNDFNYYLHLDKTISPYHINIDKFFYDTNNEKAFTIINEYGKKTQEYDLLPIYNHPNIYSKAILCIITKENYLYNEYIRDPSAVTIGMSDSTKYIISPLYKGCISLYTQFNHEESAEFVFNSESLGKLKITIDNELPNSVENEIEIIQEFTPLSMKALFKMKNSTSGKYISYINRNRIKLLINGDIIPFSLYDYSFANKQHSIDINNIYYPPGANIDIQVYFITNQSQYMLSFLGMKLEVNSNLSTVRLSLSVPLTYYAGDDLEIYIFYKDNMGYCFNKTIDSNLSFTLQDSKDFSFNEFESELVSLSFSQCSYMNKIKPKNNISPLTQAKSYTFVITQTTTNEIVKRSIINVQPNVISEKETTMTAEGFDIQDIIFIKAGKEIILHLIPFDEHKNKIDVNTFNSNNLPKIKIGTDINNYVYSVSKTNNNITFKVSIFKVGAYEPLISISALEFKISKGIRIINIEPGDCFDHKTEEGITISKTKAVPGDNLLITIQCFDEFKNQLTEKGNEQFTFQIQGSELETIGEDLSIPFSFNYESLYRIEFLLIYSGKYAFITYLNKKEYYYKIIEVNSPKCKDDEYMCMNSICVKSLSDCHEIDKECSPSQINEGEFYTCLVEGVEKKCTSVEKCDCKENFSKCDGTCLPKNENYCNNNKKSNCVDVVKARLGSDVEVNDCKDGSCRIDRCPMGISCPIGYYSFEFSCVPFTTKSQHLDNNIVCKENEIKCWDLSCANTYQNCPTKKSCSRANPTLCPDGKCVTNFIKCNQPPICNSIAPVLCPDFTCKKHIKDCLKNPTCLPGYSLCENNQCLLSCEEVVSCKEAEIRCPNGQCVTNSFFCASSMYCPKGYIKCSNGGCAASINACNFIQGIDHIVCPLESPILCPDLSCVDNTGKCNEITPCPTSLPFQCWNNECKNSKDNCSTKVKCPDDYPLLCNNGKCTKASYHCETTSNSFTEEGKIRCSDGSIVTSVILCPTQMSCGNNMILCWNGSCAQKIDACPTPKTAKCPIDNPYMCIDGSCRQNKNSCSTISICPKERPIKCYDNSCREDISLCPNYQSCGLMKNCPDGTCSSSFEECNTIVTCNQNTPFLCFDNSCAKSLEDCPHPDECKGKILCPDGICVTNRQNCKLLNSCPTKNPIKCQTNICFSEFESCSNVDKECPFGYSKCASGECKTNELFCSQINCLKHMPFLCPEGVCVKKKEHCDMSNGCPYNKPNKCPNGQCVINMDDCPHEIQCQGELCPDGSCSSSKDSCPLINGCPKERPVKCSDGTCIKSESSQCKPPLCPFNSPIKCDNGDCVDASFKCLKGHFSKDLSDCKTEGLNGFVMCSDGRCVESFDYCLPIYSCSTGYVKCDDGSCRISYNLCPLGSNCPKVRPIKCQSGACVEKEQHCNNYSFCNNSKEKYCVSTGTCIPNDQTCSDFEKPNGCTLDASYKCDDGRCFDLKEKCQTVDIACKEETPFLCPNGECKLNLSECVDDTSCSERCDNGQCVQKGERKKCVNNSGCTELLPYRCDNGECVINPNACPTTISCDVSTPFMCGNKSCVAKKEYCPNVIPCTKILCSNGFCVNSNEECDQYSKFCPISSPIKCPNGRCVKVFKDCSLSFISETCSKGQFYCQSKTKCVKNVKECFGEIAVSGKETNLLSDLFSSVQTENRCPSEYPYSCFDGTCVQFANSCPLFPACDTFEYKCPNGSCQSDLLDCNSNDDVTCANGLKKCEDGLCRITCREYKGCPINKFQCTNGMCVSNKLQCIGYSMCPDPKLPYRCIDDKCVENPYLCPDIKRLNTINSFRHSFNVHNGFTVHFGWDKRNRNIGYLTIPSNAIALKEEGKVYGEINIKEISHSSHYNTTYESNPFAKYNISTGIPASDGVLVFENAVVSPIVFIDAPTADTQFQLPGLLFIEYNIYTSYEFKDDDYCLSKLTRNGTQFWWNCTQRANAVLDYSFIIEEFGTYAVILNPERKASKDYINENNFFLNNIMTILITLAVLIIVSIIVFYIFSRIFRYKYKYEENLEKMNLLKKQKGEYEMMSTDVFGQTLGDSILGLVFTKNCLFNLKERNKEIETNMENEIYNMQKKCKEIEMRNKGLQKEIDDINQKYKILIYEINEIKK